MGVRELPSRNVKPRQGVACTQPAQGSRVLATWIACLAGILFLSISNSNSSSGFLNGSISGYVVAELDARGATTTPLQSVEITLFEVGVERTRRTWSRKNGFFEFRCLRAGEYLIQTVAKQGYKERQQRQQELIHVSVNKPEHALPRPIRLRPIVRVRSERLDQAPR